MAFYDLFKWSVFWRLLAWEMLKFWMPVDDSTETDLWAEEPPSSQFFSRVCKMFEDFVPKFFVITQLIRFGMAAVDRLFARAFFSGIAATVEKALEDFWPFVECWRWFDYLRWYDCDICLGRVLPLGAPDLPPEFEFWSQNGYFCNRCYQLFKFWLDPLRVLAIVFEAIFRIMGRLLPPMFWLDEVRVPIWQLDWWCSDVGLDDVVVSQSGLTISVLEFFQSLSSCNWYEPRFDTKAGVLWPPNIIMC